MACYKYPYISDKRMYAAVMGACSYIRETGYFNKAVSYYADKYGVDSEDLAKHIRARQAAGQKGRKSASTGRKYKWFIVCRTVYCDADFRKSYSDPVVMKGLTADTVVKKFNEADFNYTMRNDYGGSYAPVVSHEAIGEFQTELDAKRALPNWESLISEENRYGNYEPGWLERYTK